MGTPLTSELVKDETGYREWEVDSQDNGKTYVVCLRRQNKVAIHGEPSVWKWSLKDQDGNKVYSFPHDVKEWADVISEHFNESASV